MNNNQIDNCSVEKAGQGDREDRGAILDKAVKEVFSKMSFKQISECGEGVSSWISRASIFQLEGMANAKVLRQEHTWSVKQHGGPCG